MSQRIASLLAVLNLVAFFVPGVKELFLRTIAVPIGIIPLLVILTTGANPNRPA